MKTERTTTAGAAVFTTTRRGSINDLESDIQSFGINDLELVDQNDASWNRTVDWLRCIDALQRTASPLRVNAPIR
jgi:hypothetical protein